MRENTDQKSSEYEHFSRSAKHQQLVFLPDYKFYFQYRALDYIQSIIYSISKNALKVGSKEE